MSQQSNHNPGLTFLGMSGGILALVISLMILAPILCCVGACLLGAADSVVNPSPGVTP